MPKRLFLLLFIATTAHAQSLTVAATGGSSFGNMYAGVFTSAQVPVGSHLDLRVEDVFAPLEQHIALGNGTTNIASGGANIWITKSVGLDTRYDYSQYSVTKASKKAQYTADGIVYRMVVAGDMPARFTFDYLQQLNTKIAPDGTEASFLKGGEFNLELTPGCARHYCWKTMFDFQVGHVLTQSNPVCDGTFGLTGGPNNGPCPRQGALAGSFTITLGVELPKHAN